VIECSNAALVRIVLGVAEGDVDKGSLAAWFRRHARP
jgi:hypothetical protein